MVLKNAKAIELINNNAFFVDVYKRQVRCEAGTPERDHADYHIR